MKLVSCKIANFGKLCNYSHDFSDGLNVILADNGWGKSTLLTFIRAMLYGMPKSTKRDLDDNLRKKYQPWQGGNYGGHLVFETEGAQYRIERFFLSGGKGCDESFALYNVKTNKISNKYGSNIGEQLLGVDCDTFVKSACLGQQAVEITATNSINARLTELIENSSDDVKDFEVADGILAKHIKQLRNGHNKGDISALTEHLSNISYDIARNNASIGEIDALKSQQQQLQQQLDSDTVALQQVKNKLKESNKVATVKHYIDKAQELELCHNEYKQLHSIYSNFTNEQYFVENIDTQIANALALQQVQSRVQVLADSVGSMTIVEHNTFAEQVDGYIQQAVKLNQGNLTVANGTSSIDMSLCTAEHIATLDGHIATLSSASSTKSSSKLSIGRLLLTILAIITIIGIPILLAVRAKQRKAQSSGSNIYGAVAQFLAEYGIQADDSHQLAELYRLRASIVTTTEQHQQRQAILQSCQQIDQQLQQFCTRHCVSVNGQDYHTALLGAQSQVSQYNASNGKLQEAKVQCTQLEKCIIDFCNYCRITLGKDYYSSLTQVKADIKCYMALCDDIAIKTTQLEQFVASNNIDTANINKVTDGVDVASLEQQQKQLEHNIESTRQAIVNNNRLIASKTESYSMLQDLKAEQSEATDRLDKLEQQHACLSKARTLLAAARDNLSSAYLSPMKNAFAKYYNMLVGQSIEFDMDTDLVMRIVEGDMGRDVKYFSEGVKDGIMLSMRFALIETLYANAQPMVLLDDPFVNLDDNRLSNALQFVDTLSQDRQILYFTCNSART